MTRRLEELELKRIHEVQVVAEAPVQVVAEAPVQVKLCPNCQSYEHLVEECDYYQKVLFCRPNNNGFKHLTP